MFIYATLRLFAVLLVIVSIIPQLRVGAWYIRIAEFFRVQIAAAALLLCTIILTWAVRSDWTLEAVVWLLIVGLVAIWQTSHIAVYSRWVNKEIADAVETLPNRTRVAVVNLNFENGLKQQVLRQLQQLDVDLLLLIEIDRGWVEGLLPLQELYPHRIGVVRSNGLGIQLWSKLNLIEHEVRHLVSEDRASIIAHIQLSDGRKIRFVGVHPLPPGLPSDSEKGRHDSRIRDAELMLVAKIVADDPDQTWLVTGDFNDVAWSHTTRLFQRMSGLEDPRVGRGLYNTYHARYFFLRFPIDQVFISSGAEIVQLSRFRPAGSDHFAIITEFQLQAEKTSSQRSPSMHSQPLPSQKDHEEAKELIDEGQADAAKRIRPSNATRLEVHSLSGAQAESDQPSAGPCKVRQITVGQ